MEIALYVLEVGEGHSQPQAVVQLLQLLLAHVLEAVEDNHVGRLFEAVLQRCRLGLVGHTAVDGVHAMLHHSLALLLGELAADDVCGGALDDGFLAVVEQLDTLLGAVGALVELAGEILHREAEIAFLVREALLVHIVHRRFAEHGLLGLCESLVADILHVIAYKHAHLLGLDAEVFAHFVLQFLRLHSVGSLLLNKNSSNHILVFSIQCL